MTRPQNKWPIFRSLRHAGAGGWRFDLIAGLTLAAIAIPEQMATAKLGGFPPQLGFFAFIAGSLAFAAFGSSRLLSSGADSTLMPIFAGSLTFIAASGSSHYAALAATLALLVGAILIAAGVFRAGWIADLLSVPVTTGFLAGISIHIVISQVPALLGAPNGAGNVFSRVETIIQNLPRANLATLAIGLACLAAIVIGEKISSRIPSALIALMLASFAVRGFDLETHGVAVLGPVSFEFPRLGFPEVALADLPRIVGLAIIVAVVVMVQTAATSRTFTADKDHTPDVDRDFLGLGAGSALAGLIGAFPVNASPPRTQVLAETGGRSQLASLFASLLIAALAFLGGDFLASVPSAALAGVLLFVAARIFRLSDMLEIYRKTRAEFTLVVVTMLAVVSLPAQTGVGLSIILSLMHGMWATTRTRLIFFKRVPGTSIWWPEGAGAERSNTHGETLDGVLVVAFQAPLSFLNAYQFQRDFLNAVERGDEKPKLVVLEASSIVEIDFTAARILAHVIARCRSLGVDFAIARLESVRAQTKLETFGVMKELAEGRLFHSVDQAIRALAPDAKPSAR